MNPNNLHSLINGKWFIHKQYGLALLPSLFSVIEGKQSFLVQEADRPDDLFVATKNFSALITAASYGEQDSQIDYVSVIRMKDPIYKYDQECGPYGTKSKMSRMAALESDPNCVGIVLDIDSGGGQVSGTPEFYDFIKNFSKPVVAYTDGLMCSAAYYIGSASSWIVANKRADAIGSIGVMISFLDTTGIWEKKGGKVVTEYATKSTEKNRAFEELLQGKPELYIKTELDPVADDFINDIKAVRPNVAEDVFAGGTWNGPEALEKNLIDELGTLQMAVNKAFELAESSNSNSNNPKPNSKKKSMAKKTKKFSAIQGILAIEGDGIATLSTLSGKSGVQLSEAQLETLENALVEKAAAVDKAVSRITAIKAATEKAIKTAGLENAAVDAKSTSAKITLLGAKVVEYGKKPGTKVTKPKSEGDSFEEEDEEKSTSIFDGIK